jgi:hypothetical protein
MKLSIFIITLAFFSLCSSSARAQTYISLAPNITNDAGTFAEKANVAIELGRQWDVFSLGLDYGKTTLAKMHGKDTSNYLEIRPNLNIFQEGKFVNTFTAGIGYIFGARESLMTELTSGIEYTANDHIHINVYFGQYYYSGRYAASSVTFFGVSAVYYFSTSKPKSLISRQPKTN